MAKKKGLSYEEKMINALRKLPTPLEDKRHNLKIFFDDNRARSNESIFEHIVKQRHELQPSDIKRIPRYIKSSIFRKDSERSETYNIYIKRNNYNKEYIKISVQIKDNQPNIAIVKTIFITKILK